MPMALQDVDRWQIQAKKRRWDDALKGQDDDDIHGHISAVQDAHARSKIALADTRPLQPLPLPRNSHLRSSSSTNDPKRPRISPARHVQDHGQTPTEDALTDNDYPDSATSAHDARVKQIHTPTTPLPSTHDNVAKIGRSTSVDGPRTKIDLSPCHICHRRPGSKTELAWYMDCEGCERRVCGVCRRECPGRVEDVENDEERSHEEPPIGFRQLHERDDGLGLRHRSLVCSRCCVEQGVEGTICCLGCLHMAGMVGVK